MHIADRGFYTSYGEVEAIAIQSQTGSAGMILQEGAIVAADGDVFFANRIDDAFAIVDGGAPGLEVSYENRPVVRTDASGKAIVPTLNAYQPNKTRSTVWGSYIWAGAGASGVQIDFAGGTGTQSATQTIYGPRLFRPADRRGRVIPQRLQGDGRRNQPWQTRSGRQSHDHTQDCDDDL